MKADQATPRNIDEYIAGFPENVRATLEKIRKTIRKAAPEAEETNSYTIPTYTLRGNLISFGAYKEHIGLYPAPAGTQKFNAELAAYRSAKRTVRFPLDKPIPYDLITQIVKLRVKDDLERAAARGRKK